MQKGYRVQYGPRCWTTAISAFVSLFLVQSITCSAVESVKSANRQLSTSSSRRLDGDPPLPILGAGIDVDTSHDALQKTACSEDPNAIFFFSSFISNNEPVYRDCKWLGNTRKPELTCQYYTESNGDIGPAREVCRVTCNTCDLTHPSAAPSVTPTATNYPSLEPTKILKPTAVQPFSKTTNLPSLTPTLNHNICGEDSTAIFFFRTKLINNEDKPVFQTCEWLRQQSLSDLVCEFLSDSWEEEQMSTQSGETPMTTRYGPAKEVCPDTCLSCLHDGDGAPPSGSISNESSIQKSSFPTRAPILIPSLPSVERTQYPSNDYSSLPSYTMQAMVYQYLEIIVDGSTFIDPITLHSAKVVEVLELILRAEIEAALESRNDDDFTVKVYFLTEEIIGEGKENRKLWSNNYNNQVPGKHQGTFRSMQVESGQVIQFELHIEVRSEATYSQSSISEQILGIFETAQGRTHFIEELRLLDSTGMFAGMEQEDIKVRFVTSGEEEIVHTPYPWIKTLTLLCSGMTILILVGYVMFRENAEKDDGMKPDIAYEDQEDVSAYELEGDIPSPTKPFERILQTQNILPTGDFSISENSMSSTSDELFTDEAISVSDTTALPKDGEGSPEGNIHSLGTGFFTDEHEHIDDAEDETWTSPQPFERIMRTSVVIPNGDYQLSPEDASLGERQPQEHKLHQNDNVISKTLF